MDKKYFYIGLLGLVFVGDLLAMAIDDLLNFDNPDCLSSSTLQRDGYVVQEIGYIHGQKSDQSLKRQASSPTPIAKKQKKSSSRIIACGNNCNWKAARTSSNLCSVIMRHLLFSREHNADNYNSVYNQVKDKAQWDESEGRWTVQCPKNLCNTKISTVDSSIGSLTGALSKHWCSKIHNPENYQKIESYIRTVDSGENNGESFYDALFCDLVLAERDGENLNQEPSVVLNSSLKLDCTEILLSGADRYSLNCIYYPSCDKQVRVMNKNALIGYLMAHIFTPCHNEKLYDIFSCVEGSSMVCPEKGCGKIISAQDAARLPRIMLLHQHSKKHNAIGYSLLRAYVAKAFPGLFCYRIEQQYRDKNIEEIRQEYIRLFPEQKKQ